MTDQQMQMNLEIERQVQQHLQVYRLEFEALKAENKKLKAVRNISEIQGDITKFQKAKERESALKRKTVYNLKQINQKLKNHDDVLENIDSELEALREELQIANARDRDRPERMDLK